MTRLISFPAFVPRLLAVVVILSSAPGYSSAQSYEQPFDPVGSAVAKFPVLRNAIDAEMPGVANPASPYVLPPLLRGELGIKPIWINMTKGRFEIPDLGISQDLKQDVGFADHGALVEFRGRAQLGRFGARLEYDAWLRTYKGNQANLDWPALQIGADVDLIRRAGFCLGASMDVNWERPEFSLSKEGIGTYHVDWQRPVTVGVYASYNAPNFCGISTSFEAKYRHPVQADSKLTEIDIGGGIKTPETVLGTSLLRAGWRYSQLRYDSGGTKIDIDWSGFYGEYVFVY